MATHLESDLDNITGGLRFTTDKERWPAYEILLRAKLGKKLRKALDQAIETGDHEPSDAKTIDLHEEIADVIIGSMKKAEQVLVLMMRECTEQQGVKCFVWLKDKYGGGSTATLVGTMISMVSCDLSDPVKGATNIINLAACTTCNIPDEIISALILARLPTNLSAMRDSIILGVDMPSPNDLVSKISSCWALMPKNEPFNLVTTGFKGICFNCDKSDAHATRDCPLPKNKCSACGGRGHLLKHCLVANPDLPMPRTWGSDARELMQQKRDKYQKEQASSAPHASLAAMQLAQSQFLDTFKPSGA